MDLLTTPIIFEKCKNTKNYTRPVEQKIDGGRVAKNGTFRKFTPQELTKLLAPRIRVLTSPCCRIQTGSPGYRERMKCYQERECHGLDIDIYHTEEEFGGPIIQLKELSNDYEKVTDA